MIKTLQECKDEVAKRHSYPTWQELCKLGNHDGTPDKWIDEVSILFAEEALREAAEKADTVYADSMTGEIYGHTYPSGFDVALVVDKESILSIIKELK